jgi:hypothetical protein
MDWNQVREFRRKRDAVILALCLCVAAVGLLAALYDTHKIERPDWVGLTGIVVDKRLKAQEDNIYGGNVRAVLTVELDTGGRVETQIPMALYSEARIGDRVEGSKDSLKFHTKTLRR